jgi:hypothetical protein
MPLQIINLLEINHHPPLKHPLSANNPTRSTSPPQSNPLNLFLHNHILRNGKLLFDINELMLGDSQFVTQIAYPAVNGAAFVDFDIGEVEVSLSEVLH